MKKLISVMVMICLLISLSACSGKQSTSDIQTNTSSSDSAVFGTQGDSQENGEGNDPYAADNRYDVAFEMFEKQSGTDYGTLLKDVTYYSSVAGDHKQVNILLPAGYDENETYPVMYVVHGFDGDHNAHINSDSYLTLLYGNMLHDDLTVPMILVGIDMYTDKLADKESKSYEELRYIYDKCIDEIKIDLMPFVEQNYPVSTERKDTAVAGVSEGGAKSLCIGFQWLDEFGWIGGFAPDANVIPTGSAEWESYWTDPYMQEFPQPNENNTPYYLYMAVGSEDPWNIDCTLYYRDVLNEMGVRNQTDYVEGCGHDADFWGQCFYNFLSKIFQE